MKLLIGKSNFIYVLVFISFILAASILFFSCSSPKNSPGNSLGAAPSAPETSWTRVGIGGGGAMFNPAISPHNINEVMVACDMTCSFASSNGGESWREFNLHGPVAYFVYDPIDSNTVYAKSVALFKSSDKGHSWNLLYPAPQDVKQVIRKGDHAEEQLVTIDSTRREVLGLAIDPADSKKLYAAISIDKSVALYNSVDGGSNWTKEKELTGGAKNIFIDPSSPPQSRTIFITSKNSITVRKNGEWKINAAPDGVKTLTTFTAGHDKKNNQYIIYAISGKSYFNHDDEKSGIYYTNNGGESWENRQQGLLNLSLNGSPLPEWRTIATSASHPEILYISYQKLQTATDTFFLGVAKSNDYGKTWELKWKDLENKRPDAGEIKTDDWIISTFGAGWGENPFSLAVSDIDPNICYGTDFGRTMKTVNGGSTWSAMNSRKNGESGWTTRGLDVTCNYSVVMDPFDSTHFFIPYTDIGLMESRDGGTSWKSATDKNGVPRKWQNSTYWLSFDPEIKGRAWAAMSPVHDLPRPKMWRGKGTSGFSGGIVMTNDAGKTWNIVSETIGEAAITHILIDPNSNKNNRTLYACAFGKGVYKSLDGGKTWGLKNKGILSNEPLAWRITRRNDGTLFLIINRRSDDSSSGNINTDGAIYKSADGAESWTKINLPPGTNGPTSVSLEENNNKLLLLSAWGKPAPGKFSSDTGGGIFVSEDEGNSWKNVMVNDQHIHDLTFDHRNKRFYACGFEGSAYYSEDEGKSWNRIKGYNFKWGRRVVPDPLDQNKVYILTFGGGVWHGPATGEPAGRQDIVTPVFQFH